MTNEYLLFGLVSVQYLENVIRFSDFILYYKKHAILMITWTIYTVVLSIQIFDFVKKFFLNFPNPDKLCVLTGGHTTFFYIESFLIPKSLILE